MSSFKKIKTLLFGRVKCKIYTCCRFCKNTDTQHLILRNGYLSGYKGIVNENLAKDNFASFYKGEPWCAHSCFCCGAVWHQAVFEKHWFWTRWNWIKFESDRVTRYVISKISDLKRDNRVTAQIRRRKK